VEFRRFVKEMSDLGMIRVESERVFHIERESGEEEEGQMKDFRAIRAASGGMWPLCHISS